MGPHKAVLLRCLSSLVRHESLDVDLVVGLDTLLGVGLVSGGAVLSGQENVSGAVTIEVDESV